MRSEQLRVPLFGVGISAAAGGRADPVAVAQAAESLGFDFVSMNDHVHGPDSRLEAWTALAWIAASTTRVRLATRVLGVPYRTPALVAKMAESFDRLSAGRLILGLGAGSGEGEYEALGLPVRTLRERFDGLEDAIRLIRGLWSNPTYTFEGSIYRTHDAQLEPKPGHPIPIWIGAHGARGLAITGRLADGWIPSLGNAPPDRIAEMIGSIRRAAGDAGRDPNGVLCVYNVEVSVGGRKSAPDAATLSGSRDDIAQQLIAFTTLGFGGFNLIPSGDDLGGQLQLLGEAVIPAVRTAVA